MSLVQTAYVAGANVPKREALQAAVGSLGFDCQIDSSYTPLKSSGFLPCILAGRESGFEIYFEPAAVVLENIPQLAESVGSRDVAITFRWGGDMAECACVLIVSAALAKNFDAVVHYHEDDMLLSGEELVTEARAAIESL